MYSIKDYIKMEETLLTLRVEQSPSAAITVDADLASLLRDYIYA